MFCLTSWRHFVSSQRKEMPLMGTMPKECIHRENFYQSGTKCRWRFMLNHILNWEEMGEQFRYLKKKKIHSSHKCCELLISAHAQWNKMFPSWNILHSISAEVRVWYIKQKFQSDRNTASLHRRHTNSYILLYREHSLPFRFSRSQNTENRL